MRQEQPIEQETIWDEHSQRVCHPFAPVWNTDSKVLILGSLPSVQSRKQNFYYAHPQNRFWKVLAAIFNEPVPQTVAAKKAFLLSHNIAIWDVIASCTINGSSDASIKNVNANDPRMVITHSKIDTILCNGKTAEKYYQELMEPLTGMPCQVLPSTSPANAQYSLEDLTRIWKEAIDEALSDRKGKR